MCLEEATVDLTGAGAEFFINVPFIVVVACRKLTTT